MDIGAEIRRRRKALKWTLQDLEARTGIDNGNLSRLERGTQKYSQDTIEKIAAAFEITLSQLFSFEHDTSNTDPKPETVQGKYVAIVGMAQGNADGYINITDYSLDDGDGYIYTYSRDVDAYGIRVRGDSMRPRIKSGEYIVAEPNTKALPGDDVVIRLKDKQALVKELLWIRDDEVSLGSINNDIPPRTIQLKDIGSIHRIAAIVPRGSATNLAGHTELVNLNL
jgi:phage repressor protein C with HTH and peptisase S24 domain